MGGESDRRLRMEDRYGRKIEYMRISITDRCNLRCSYCMPEGVEWIPMEEILTYEEIVRVCRQAVTLGIRKFKITGGEPLVRKGCADLIRMIKEIPETEQVTMTTNGVLLGTYLDSLLDAGLDAVNISLDSLNPERYEEITGYDRLGEVLDSVRKASAGGIPVKINSVLQEGLNEEEWEGLLELARENEWKIRFIELMPIGSGKFGTVLSNETLLRKISEKYPGIERDPLSYGNGPAVYYKIPGFVGRAGFISALHGKFCSSCNRIRMTSCGEIKPCLCYRETLTVREALRHQDDESVRKILECAVKEKPKMHCFDKIQEITESRGMEKIGG